MNSWPEKTDADTRRFAEMVSSHQGWKLNGDPAFLETLIRGLTANFNRYGYYLCPCRDTAGSRERDQDVICPCVYCPPDLEEYGHCFCALYLTEEFSASGKEPSGIPERRPERLIP